MSLVTRGRAFIAVAALVALATFTMGSTAEAQAPATGRVRVMHASPDAPAVDIFVDGAKAVTALAFPKNTGNVSLPAGPHNVKVFASPSDGSGKAVLEADLSVGAGKDYTVLAIGQLGNSTLALLPLEDNNASPAEGKAHIRLIHASPDAPAVNVAVAGTKTNVFTNVGFKGVGAYTPVAAGSYDLDVNVASSGQTVKTVNGLTLENKGVYTAVAVGLAGNGTLQVVPLVDVQPQAPAAPRTGSGVSSSSDSVSPLFLAASLCLLLAGGMGLTYAVRRSR